MNSHRNHDQTHVEATIDDAVVAVSIVTNSRLLGEGLVPLLEPYLNVYTVATYSGPPRNVSQPPNPPGHVALLDSGVGRHAAEEWTLFWRNMEPSVLVLVLELADDVDLILACIEAGANGYTLKGASSAEVARQIKLISQGCAQCSPEVTAQLFARVRDLKDSNRSNYYVKIPLTPRELEVLHHVARGYSNKEIAQELVITVRTVKHHVHNILGKLELSDRHEAAYTAIQQGWLNSDLMEKATSTRQYHD